MNKIIGCLLLLFSSVIATAQETLMTPVNASKQAVGFTLSTPNGDLINLSDYEGKYVLANFWSHWCSPCLLEFPDMQKLYAQADRTNFETIAVHAGTYNEQAAKIVNDFKIRFPVVSDSDTNLEGWDVPVLPTSYLISPHGEIIFKALGPREWSYEALKVLISLSED